jgi:signal peptidase I
VTRSEKPLARSLLELVVIVAAALAVALAIEALLIKPYVIPSGSMEPTLAINQRVLVDRIGSDFSNPGVGSIVVFHPPTRESCANPQQGQNQAGQQSATACDATQSKPSTQTYIKRVVGLPGDRLWIRGGHVYRNGVREADSFITPCGDAAECNFPHPITVPKGDYYMMGDNRGDSLDSRFWGPVPRSWIIGQAFFTYWPPDRFGLL